MKKSKFISMITATVLITCCAAIDVSASTSKKAAQDVITMIDSGAENINVYLKYTVDSAEISSNAEKLSYEYAESLDKNMYSEKEIESLRFEYYYELYNKMYIDAVNKMTDAILSELGVSPENAECPFGYYRISCSLSPEQIAIAENMESITKIYLNEVETILPNSLEQLVAEDTSFTNNSFIYSDKYKFALESGAERDTLIVYGIPEEDCYGEWRKHIVTNSRYTYGMADWFPAGENRSVYSGFQYDGVVTMSSTIKLEKPLDVLFFVNDEVPYYAENVDEASQQIGFDISPYIYSIDITSIKYNVPQDVEPTKYGDVTGDQKIDISDVVALNLFSLNPDEYPLTDSQIANADCHKDGVIDSSDSTMLMNYICELIDIEQLGK